MGDLIEQFSGPVLFSYVWWVLYQAVQMRINRLYFLARDGCLLREIAGQFCRKYSLPIECRYLYCSRTALRMPCYHLIGEEAYDLLLLGGYRVSLRSILDRAGLGDSERQDVYQECGLTDWDENTLLQKKELAVVRDLLRRSHSYRQAVDRRSREVYPAAMGYLRQEGLFEGGPAAIVDSGWTGSMQRSLRQLLQSGGYTGEIIGFYFGMYAAPKGPEDGTYLTWFFSGRADLFRKIPFNNNLFECLLSAPHGMTSGYKLQNGTYVPTCLPCTEDYAQKVREQMERILNFTGKKLETAVFERFDAKRLRQESKKIISRYMARPNREEAAALGEYLFCDDVTEGYFRRLADASQTPALKNYAILRRIYRRLAGRPAGGTADLYWPCGTAAFLPPIKRLWYRWNIYLWELLRYVL